MVDLRRELSGLPLEFIVTIVVSAPEYNLTMIEALNTLVNESGLSGLYLTVNRPYENINTLLQTNSVDTERLFFIDAVTKSAMEKPERSGRCLYIPSPESLTEISIALSQAAQAMSGDGKFIFLDSVSALLIYNQAETVARFVHILTVKIREWKIMGVFISLEKETDEILFSRLSQFSDKVIMVDGGR